MKKIFSLALSFALIFGLASCSKDNTLSTPEGGDGLSSISFTFNKPKEAYVQTYADIASAAEWFIETLDVYAAVDGTVSKLTAGSSDDYVLVENTKSYTITMTSDWVSPNTGKTVNFYFVGNDATSIEGAQSELAATAEATFKNALTDEIQKTGDKVNLIEANGSTKNLLFSAVIENVRVVGKVQKSGTLKRREARFDIVNTDNANVTINKIYVSDASRKGLIFTNADVAAPAITKGSHKDIAGPTVYDATGLATSVFYLYPTTLSETGTKIYLEATANGNTSMYQVEVAADFEILPNTRYKIVLDPATMVFTLIVADYDEGDEFPVVPGAEGGVTLGKIIDPTNILSGTFYFFNDNTSGQLTVPVKSTYGTTAEVNYLFGAVGDFTVPVAVSTPSTVTTYGFATVDTYSITIPESDDLVGPFDIEVKFISKADATQSQTIRFIRMDAEKLIGTVTNPGVKNILYYDALEDRGLNLDGVGKPLYFKWGSLIGIDGTKDNFVLFDSEHVLYAPTEYTLGLAGLKAAIDGKANASEKWYEIPYLATGELTTGITANGTGDPCRLASKGGAGVGVGNFKMASGNPFNGSLSEGTWGVAHNVFGRTIDGQFYPANGYRNDVNSNSYHVGRFGIYWSSTPHEENSGQAYSLSFRREINSMSASAARGAGFSVRCVPAN